MSMRRRAILALTGTAMATLAGCNTDESGVEETPQSQESESDTGDDETAGSGIPLQAYPDGFGQSGVRNFEAAFGTESEFYNLDTFEYSDSRVFYNLINTFDPRPHGILANQQVTMETRGWVSGRDGVSYKDMPFYYNDPDESGNLNLIIGEEEYTSVNGTISRSYETFDRENASYDTYDRTFDKEQDYFVGLLRRLVDRYFEPELIEVETPDGTMNAIEYTARSYPDDEFYEDYDNMEGDGGNGVRMTIREDGMPLSIYYNFEVIVRMDDGDERPAMDDRRIQFSDFNAANTDEPEWFADAISATDATEDMFR